MSAFFTRIHTSNWFQNAIVGVILLAAIAIGLDTYPSIRSEYGGVLSFLDKTILGIFVVEIVIKILAEGKKPWRYFKDGWNIFDFLIVAVCFLPFNAQYVAVLRLARILRVLRLITVLPKLQLLVGALLRSLPSMVYVGLLLSILFYIYGVTGTMLFSQNDPIHFGTLQDSLLSLFRVVTLEDWTDLMYINMYGSAEYGYDGNQDLIIQSQAQPLLSITYFVSFVLFGTMVMLNLFIGVIMNGMQEAQLEAEERNEQKNIKELGHATLEDDINNLEHELTNVQTHLASLKRKLKHSQEDS
ncbi:ion transporter [Pelagicoccus mobilis]|uniref:Ion transporter n=1 Tax=Pelagicoccus mobilis TaxID=415221 RepID=A0A934VQK4_9BACT|nr:ion transporter [Pelagicoccus mobilis]MBK1876995.1 ion transporter [Pelagicoccus mobilis]